MGVLIIGAKTNRLDLLNAIAEMSFPATFTVKNESQIPILLHYQGVYLEPVYVADKNAADIVFENSETLRNLVEIGQLRPLCYCRIRHESSEVSN